MMKRQLSALFLAVLLTGCGKSTPTPPAPPPPPSPVPPPTPAPKPVAPRPVTAIGDLISEESRTTPLDWKALGFDRVILLDRQNLLYRPAYSAADASALVARIRKVVPGTVKAGVSFWCFDTNSAAHSLWGMDDAEYGVWCSRVTDVARAEAAAGLDEFDVDTEAYAYKDGAFSDPSKAWLSTHDPAARGRQLAAAVRAGGIGRLALYDYFAQETRCAGFPLFAQAAAPAVLYDESIFASGGPASTLFNGPTGVTALFPKVPVSVGITTAHLSETVTASDQAAVRNYYAAGCSQIWVWITPASQLAGPKAAANLRLLASLGVK